jgi:hypothetical protein
MEMVVIIANVIWSWELVLEVKLALFRREMSIER